MGPQPEPGYMVVTGQGPGIIMYCTLYLMPTGLQKEAREMADSMQGLQKLQPYRLTHSSNSRDWNSSGYMSWPMATMNLPNLGLILKEVLPSLRLNCCIVVVQVSGSTLV